jgi:hypothetical protein
MSKTVLKTLFRNCRRDPMWLRISHKFIERVPYKYMEKVLVAIFTQADRHVTLPCIIRFIFMSCLLRYFFVFCSYQDVSNVIGDSILSNANMKYIITNKLVFLKVFDKNV